MMVVLSMGDSMDYDDIGHNLETNHNVQVLQFFSYSAKTRALHFSSRRCYPPRAVLRSEGMCVCVGENYKRPPNSVVMMVKPTIQFIQGTDEQTILDVRLTKSRDGTNGMAIFLFEQPYVFDSSGDMGDITGFYMIDEEGVFQSVDVSTKFVNGKPAGIEAKYVMRMLKDWDRFMRFMERYSN